eukprot:SM007486S22006  [mRNA]  locus=s7486:2:638:- [translate_table: standard]
MAWQDGLAYGLQDPQMRPRLLQALALAALPDNPKAAVTPKQLAAAAGAVCRHHLLSEWPPPLAPPAQQGG